MTDRTAWMLSMPSAVGWKYVRLPSPIFRKRLHLMFLQQWLLTVLFAPLNIKGVVQGNFLFHICCGHESSHKVPRARFCLTSLLCSILSWVSSLDSLFSVLQLFCSSPKPVLRYAAVRTLNKVSASRSSKQAQEHQRKPDFGAWWCAA